MGFTVPTSPVGAVHEEPPVQNEVGQQDRHNHDLCESSLISKPGELALAGPSGYERGEGSPKTLQWVGSAKLCGVFRSLCRAKHEGNRVGAQGRFCASVSLCKGASQGRGDPRLLFLLLFQLSAVEAGGSTAFIYANFSVPVVKVRSHLESLGAGKGGRCYLYLSSCREFWPRLS